MARWGAPAAVGSMFVSSMLVAAVIAWSTPYLLPVSILLLLIPVMAGYSHVPPKTFAAMVGILVVAAPTIAVVSTGRHLGGHGDDWTAEGVVLAVSIPVVLVVIVLAMVQANRIHQRQADEIRDSRTQVAAVADAARRSLERDLHDGAQQRLASLSLLLGHAHTLVERGDRAAMQNSAGPGGEQPLRRS